MQVATELGVSTFSRERRGELMLTKRGSAGRADASLRLPQADLARYDWNFYIHSKADFLRSFGCSMTTCDADVSNRLLFGSVELELLLLEPGVELTVWNLDPGARTVLI